MAKPIKETPILKGKQASAFINNIRKNETDTSNRVSKESFEKSKRVFDKLLANAKF